MVTRRRFTDTRYLYIKVIPCSDQSACLVEDHLCDCVPRCKNGEDEKNCQVCNVGGVHSGLRTYRCPGNNSKCIHYTARCNNIPSCPNGLDELDCLTACPYNEKHLYYENIYDGHKDCPGGEDEINC